MSSGKTRYAGFLKHAVYIYTVLLFLCPISTYAGIFSRSTNDTNAYENVSGDVHPFNNMARKFILLAQDVLNNTQKPTDEPVKDQVKEAVKEPEKKQEKAAPQNEDAKKDPSLPQLDNKLPLTSITSPKVQATETANPNTTPMPNTKTAVASTPEQKPGEVKLEDPKIVQEVPKVEELSITPPKISEDKVPAESGLIQKFFRAEQEKFVGPSKPTAKNPKTNVSVGTPLPEKAIVIKEEPVQKKVWPAPPTERPGSYKTQRLSDSISKKAYSRDNEHLPKAAYNEEYKKILFDSAAVGNLDVLRAMLDSFADTEILNEEGDTPLIYATMAGNLESMLTLTSMGANINAQNFYGITPLYAATKLGRIDLVKIAISRSSNPELADKNGKTPIMLAAEMDFSSILQILLNNGADIDKRMKNGDMALHLAAKNSSLASMNILITKGAEIENRNFKGYTPLMVAVETGQDRAVALLLNAGADISKANAQGEDVVMMAKNSSNNAIVELLESEKIRQKLVAEKLIETRKTKVSADIEEKNKDEAELPESKTARRVGGIPLPFKRPLNTAKPLVEELNNSKNPKPFFSVQEMEQMQNN